MLPFARVSIIGLGLIGSSIARAVREHMPTVRLTGHDTDPQVRQTADRLHLCDDIADTAGAAVTDADLVILCVPVGAMESAAREIADDLPQDAIVSDVGSVKASAAASLRAALPGAGWARGSCPPTLWPAPSIAGRKRVSRRCSTAAGAS
jgi:cyclohexadieny/prephenate dehydrogenase